jgi:hypothetical protein
MCIAPDSTFRRVLQDIRELGMAAWADAASTMSIAIFKRNISVVDAA